MSADTSEVILSGVRVSYGDLTAVPGADLDIAGGEFFTLLGPSGCGKTTLLRTVAGFIRQDSGTVTVGETILDDLPAHKRDTGLVFQSYAVFPHLNVLQNVQYGLRSRGIRGSQARERVERVLAMVGLEGYEDRMPAQLSGGQQQRVVIARAVVVQPRVLLMDEPLANLDAKLRVRLRTELKELQRELGTTTIYVTHDQEEALSLSDRIAVMSSGQILQVGTPEDIYARPASLSVAEFIGEGTFVRGQAAAGTVSLGDAQLPASGLGGDLEGPVWAGFRPHDVDVTAAGPGTLTGTVHHRSYLGGTVRLEVRDALERPVAVDLSADAAAHVREGETIHLHVRAEKLMLFPGDDRDADL